MLRKNKHLNKELQNKIERLEKDNTKLKSDLNKAGLTSKTPTSLSLYLQTELIDILNFSSGENKFSYIELYNELNVLKELPENKESFIELINPEDQEALKTGFIKINPKSPFKLQTKLHFYNQEVKGIVPVEIILINNNDSTVSVIIKDIAAAQRQKRELSKIRERMDESNKLKSTLLSNISHQIRTPLNSITGFSELLASSDADKTKRKDYIEIIKRQSKRILNLIDNISEINKLESGEINISRTECNLNLLLNELYVGLNQQRVNKRKELVKLELDLPDSSTNEIISDSGRLQQALLNIINFSLRNTQQGKIKFGYDIDEENLKVEFFIHDTSDGLTKEEQKVIFNRFMVIEQSENTQLEDPGLGLTISKEIIKAMGGKIWVESEKGEGTSFHFSIPYEKVAKSSEPIEQLIQEVTEEKIYNWSNKVILIVDDEDVNAMFLDAVFQGTGAQILYAKNGLQAIELVKNISKIDLILMDMKMPVMDGLKATKEIRKLNTNIPIIAQTAMASEEDLNYANTAGCNETIFKPIEVEEVMQKVNKYFTD